MNNTDSHVHCTHLPCIVCSVPYRPQNMLITNFLMYFRLPVPPILRSPHSPALPRPRNNQLNIQKPKQPRTSVLSYASTFGKSSKSLSIVIQGPIRWAVVLNWKVLMTIGTYRYKFGAAPVSPIVYVLSSLCKQYSRIGWCWGLLHLPINFHLRLSIKYRYNKIISSKVFVLIGTKMRVMYLPFLLQFYCVIKNDGFESTSDLVGSVLGFRLVPNPVL